MAFSQIATSVTIINSGLIGYCGISLTDYSASAVSSIASGSGVEIAGAFFKASTDTTINASSWTAITTATTAYLHLVPSGTAGSQVITAQWSSVTPVWSTSKQGWYASAASTTRVVGTAYKNGPTSQWYKNLQLAEPNSHGIAMFNSSGTWFCPVNRIWVTGCAAGTNGSAGSVYSGGGGGAGGSWVWKSPYDVTQGTVYTVTIGASGTATTIVGILTLTSGTILGGVDTYKSGATGFNAGGSPGWWTGTGASGGGGGGGSLGSGGNGGCAEYAGNAGGQGAGGGGGGGSSTSGKAGGTGGSAIIVIEW